MSVRQILAERNIPVIIIATKADKLSRSNRIKSLALISRQMTVHADSIVPVSVKDSSVPVTAVWERVLPALKGNGLSGESVKNDG